MHFFSPPSPPFLPISAPIENSLPQPHLDRTKLCELNDTELDQRYVTQRDGLRQVVQDRAHAKVVGGQQLTGKTLAQLLQSLISALNAKEIPTGASLIESFNREIVAKALAQYVSQLDAAVQLPVEASALDQVGGRGNEGGQMQVCVQVGRCGLLGSLQWRCLTSWTCVVRPRSSMHT